jgi:endo-1,4-beta-D-glucanase Y
VGRLRQVLTRRPLLAVAATVGVLALAVAAGLLGGGPAPSPQEKARSAARAFLDRYVAPDGRVVRHDQGGDTVSEGQAYAMLAAVVAGDRTRFRRVWRWTSTHLARPDGLLAWRWQNGSVTGPEPAADADLDAAHALLLASRRFRDPGAARQARRMADAMRGAEIRDGVLLAGPWARDQGVVNPSYFDPRALRALHMDDVEGATRRAVAPLLAGGRMPVDWSAVGPPPRPTGNPSGGGTPSYGFDAARVPIRLAASCDPADRRLVAGLKGLDRAASQGHPVFTVAAAAQAQAAGDRSKAAALLDRAADEDRAAPTYYGAAWVALGRALLQTRLLGSCPPGR